MDTNTQQESVQTAPISSSSENTAVIIGIVVVLLFLAAIAAGIYFSGRSADVVGHTTLSGSSTSENVVDAGDEITVDYVGTLDDGTVFDTSIQERAQQAGVYQTARAYEPLRFTVGQGQMIAGFDRAVVGMELGETKTFTIPAKDAYGEAMIEETVSRDRIADTITQEVPKEDLADRIVRTFPKEFFANSSGALVPGGQIQIAAGMNAEVVTVGDTDVTIAIDNTESPFYGKPIQVGMTGSYQGNEITVKEETASGYLLAIENRSSPFYGKTLAVGLSGATTDGMTLTITALTDSEATIAVPNQHELAGKDLTFEVTIRSIQAPSMMPDFSSFESGAAGAETTSTGATER
ncbi:MAG TPA: FKBP-type peptidyl-prolyl cis-trans isomerase [bacterium]|nr:FKBP-type peptidyl-prolyl cis-trans isomerase [bacterium]